MRTPMIPRSFPFALSFVASLVAIAGSLISQPVAAQPRSLDVPYVPTPEHIVDAMLKLANLGPSDFLVDLGCGDGRIPIAAARKFGTPGFGVDLNPVRIIEARANAEKAGVTDKVQFIEGDLFQTDFQKASVLTLYLLPAVNMRLRPQILEMKPGTRVVSHAFNFDDWQPDASEQYDFRRVYYWMVPAKVAGKWSGNWTGTMGTTRLDVEFDQKFQMLTGVLQINGKPAPITAGKMTGEQIGFEANVPGEGVKTFAGRLDGAVLSGAGWSLKRL